MAPQRWFRMWRAASLALLLAGAAAFGPLGAGAETPGTLIPFGSGTGSGSVTLSGGNTISVALNGVAAGASFNVFACLTMVSRPAPQICTIGNAQLVASGSGQASASVSVAISDLAISAVLVQNVANSNETYVALVNGATATSGTASFSAPISAGSSSAPATGGAAPSPSTTAPMGGSSGGPGY